MAAKKNYAVGKGKPPLHSRFKKGESGNPSGKPGANKSFHARLRSAIEHALANDFWEIEHGLDPKEPLQRIANQIVYGAARAEPYSLKLLLTLGDKYDATDMRLAEAGGGTTSGAAADAETQGDSLPQGKTQGNFGTPSSPDENAVSKQAPEQA